MNPTIENELSEKWSALRAAEPRLRIRDVAARLGTSEAALLATGCGEHVTRLEPEWDELLDACKTLGYVMCLTRNEHAVHERNGHFREIGFFAGGAMGQVVGPDIDLRLFPRQWTTAFAVRKDDATGANDSIQIFGSDGSAMHKVFLEDDSDRAAFDALIADRKADDQSPTFDAEPSPEAEVDRPDGEIDLEGLREAWRGLQDTHEFFSLLKKFSVGRVQALRLVGEEFAEPLPTDVTGTILRAAAASELPIMVFVGNRGCLQIHTGTVSNIQPFKDWTNVLDPEFNLHLRDSGVASAWRVRKPTRDGVVTAVELYDADGGNIALIFGKRKPGEVEDGGWRELAEGLS